MKKSLFLLSLMTLAIAGCTNNSTDAANTAGAEVADASTAWQTDVQQTQMPSTMTQPTYQAPTYSTPQPVASNYGTETVGNCQVVRDSANKPIYSQITKGCYTDSQYTVGASDTLYLIGYLTGTSASQIASMNNLNPTAKLPVGKVLRVR